MDLPLFEDFLNLIGVINIYLISVYYDKIEFYLFTGQRLPYQRRIWYKCGLTH